MTTILSDEALHSTAVWIDYDAEADQLLINTERKRRKTKNARNEPRIAVSMTDLDNPYRMLSIICALQWPFQLSIREAGV